MKPDCKMTLAFSSVGDRYLQCKSACLSSSSSRAISHPFMHWEFYCDFNDGEPYKMEAFLDKDNLVPCMRRAGRDDMPRDKVFLGVFKRSFEDVSIAYHALSDIKKYDVLENNCQTWVVAFLEELSIPVPEEVRTIAETIEKIFSDNGEGEAYDFVVEKVRNAFKFSTRFYERSAPEDREEDDNNGVEDDNKKD